MARGYQEIPGSNHGRDSHPRQLNDKDRDYVLTLMSSCMCFFKVYVCAEPYLVYVITISIVDPS